MKVKYKLFISSHKFGMSRDKAELQSFDLARDEWDLRPVLQLGDEYGLQAAKGLVWRGMKKN